MPGVIVFSAVARPLSACDSLLSLEKAFHTAPMIFVIISGIAISPFASINVFFSEPARILQDILLIFYHIACRKGKRIAREINGSGISLRFCLLTRNFSRVASFQGSPFSTLFFHFAFQIVQNWI